MLEPQAADRTKSSKLLAKAEMVRRVWQRWWGAAGEGKQQEDVVSQLIGGWGRWQLLVVLSVSLVKLSSGWVQLAVVFLTPPPAAFRCVQPNAANNSCVAGHCERYEWDASPLESTLVTEFALVCERAPLASLVQSVLQLGVLLGSALFGILSDRFGRRRALLTAAGALVAAGLLQPLAPGYWALLGARLLLGAAAAGTMVVSFVLVMETVGPTQRHTVGCLFQLPFIVGHMTLPLFAYYWRRWRAFSLALALPQLVYVGYYWTLPESPRWLLGTGRGPQAAALLRTAAKWNKRPSDHIEQEALRLAQELHATARPAPHYGALLTRPLRVRTAGVLLLWLVSGLSFFGFNQYIGQTSRDMFASVAVAGAIQLPANVATMGLLAWLGRRRTVALGYLLSGVGAGALAALPAGRWAQLALGALGVSGAALACTALYVYTSELFPTVVRNMALGAGSTSMRVGAIAAPWAAAAGGALPSALFATAPLLAALLVLALPDTTAHTLPDTLEPAPAPAT